MVNKSDFHCRPGPGKVRPRPGPQPAKLLLTSRPGPASFRPAPGPALQVSGPHPARPAKYHRNLARPGPWAACRPAPRAEARPVRDPTVRHQNCSHTAVLNDSELMCLGRNMSGYVLHIVALSPIQ